MLCGLYPIRSCAGTAYRTLFNNCRSPSAEEFVGLLLWVMEGIGMALGRALVFRGDLSIDWIEQHGSEALPRRCRGLRPPTAAANGGVTASILRSQGAQTGPL